MRRYTFGSEVVYKPGGHPRLLSTAGHCRPSCDSYFSPATQDLQEGARDIVVFSNSGGIVHAMGSSAVKSLLRAWYHGRASLEYDTVIELSW